MRPLLLAGLSLVLVAQEPLSKSQELARFHPKVPTPSSTARLKAFEQRQALLAQSPFQAIPFRNIGPMGQGGRVVAVAVDERRPSAMVAAFATGGLWFSDDEGASWRSLFDHESAFAIGDVAVRWGRPGEPAAIWVGTGEANASRSSYAGAGVFRSLDGGRTWQNLGLPDSHRIARVVLHPTQPDVAYVAAQGPLYTEGGQRGVYKTTDGGKTWTQVLRTPERTGATELVMDPAQPDTLYAATLEKDRKAWNFLESGTGSGIHKTTDGGKTWTRLAGGLPGGDAVGRIGLAISRQTPGKLYAFVDLHTLRGKGEADPFEDPDRLTPRKLRAMDEAALAKVEAKPLKAFLKEFGFPEAMTAESLQADLKAGKVKVRELLTHLDDGNAALFDTDIVGQELFVTKDGGATWSRTHAGRLEDIGYTYGYYFGQVRVDPKDDERVFIWGVPLLESRDGGKTFKGVNGLPEYAIHADHHALFIDPADPRRMLVGHDGGLDLTTDGGRSWRGLKNLPVGQFYTIHADSAEPYRVYGGLQDNGVKSGPATPLREGQQVDRWRALYGGDGGYVQVDPRDNATVYTEYQFGHMARLDGKGGSKDIRPKHAFRDAPYRFNWITPLVLSPHSADILYTGTQKVLRSLDRGDTWTEISKDLTSAPAAGDVPFGTISALAESPKRFGLLYAGTDDGLLWCSRDGGFSWNRIGKGLPARWVSRVEPSRHAEGTVFVTLNAYRQDESAALVYRSDDHGATFTAIKGNLPDENVNVIREDPARKDLLYLGTDFGVYASLDGGKAWVALGQGMPNVPVHDLFIQAKAKDLLVGTHGRSAYVAPIAPLQELTPELRAKPLHLLPLKGFKAQRGWKLDRPSWYDRGQPEGKALFFHAAQAGAAELKLVDEKKAVQRTWKVAAVAGLNRIDWDLLVDAAVFPDLPPGRRPFVRPGSYTWQLSLGSATAEAPLKVEAPDEEGRGRRSEMTP